VLTRMPRSVDISAGEIYPVAQEVIRRIVEGISSTLGELAPEVAGDIYDRGIILTGGGALFGGLDDYLREETKLPVRVADEPRYAIVRGLEQMFDEPLLMRRLMRQESQISLNLETETL
jgi:rod shape-determining protein MreB and related proteins